MDYVVKFEPPPGYHSKASAPVAAPGATAQIPQQQFFYAPPPNPPGLTNERIFGAASTANLLNPTVANNLSSGPRTGNNFFAQAEIEKMTQTGSAPQSGAGSSSSSSFALSGASSFGQQPPNPPTSSLLGGSLNPNVNNLMGAQAGSTVNMLNTTGGGTAVSSSTFANNLGGSQPLQFAQHRRQESQARGAAGPKKSSFDQETNRTARMNKGGILNPQLTGVAPLGGTVQGLGTGMSAGKGLWHRLVCCMSVSVQLVLQHHLLLYTCAVNLNPSPLQQIIQGQKHQVLKNETKTRLLQ